MSHFNCRFAYNSLRPSAHCPKLCPMGTGALTHHRIKIHCWRLQTGSGKWGPQTPIKIVNTAQWRLKRSLLSHKSWSIKEWPSHCCCTWQPSCVCAWTRDKRRAPHGGDYNLTTLVHPWGSLLGTQRVLPSVSLCPNSQCDRIWKTGSLRRELRLNEVRGWAPIW